MYAAFMCLANPLEYCRNNERCLGGSNCNGYQCVCASGQSVVNNQCRSGGSGYGNSHTVSGLAKQEERTEGPRRLGLRPKPRGVFAARMMLGALQAPAWAPTQTPLGAPAPRPSCAEPQRGSGTEPRSGGLGRNPQLHSRGESALGFGADNSLRT